MATLSVVNFSDKLNVLQENYTNDQSNKRQIIFLTSNSDTSQNNTKSKKSSKTMTRIHNPPPVAVARRNARERNRVKQVNNGFATLRQHIPTTIAAAYESGNGRGSNKKLSKVETLRMAVEYIKSLEKLLNIDENTTNNNSTTSVINYSTSSISPNSSQFNSTYYSTGTDDDDDLHTTPRNHTLKKNYQLMYEDEENIHPLKMEQMEDHLLQDQNLLQSDLLQIDNTSLSPEVYSEHSLSPSALDQESKTFIPVFNSTQNLLPSFSHIVYDRLPQVKSEMLSPNHEYDEKTDQRVCIITRNELNNSHDQVIDVMWWDSQQSQNQQH